MDDYNSFKYHPHRVLYFDTTICCHQPSRRLRAPTQNGIFQLQAWKAALKAWDHKLRTCRSPEVLISEWLPSITLSVSFMRLSIVAELEFYDILSIVLIRKTRGCRAVQALTQTCILALLFKAKASYLRQLSALAYTSLTCDLQRGNCSHSEVVLRIRVLQPLTLTFAGPYLLFAPLATASRTARSAVISTLRSFICRTNQIAIYESHLDQPKFAIRAPATLQLLQHSSSNTCNLAAIQSMLQVGRSRNPRREARPVLDCRHGRSGTASPIHPE